MSILYKKDHPNIVSGIQTTRKIGNTTNSASWTYIKFENGIAFAWAWGSSTPLTYNAWGGIYSSGDTNAVGYAYPPNLFISAPYTMFSPRPSGHNFWLITSSSTNSTTVTDSYQCARGTSLSNASISIHLFTVGWWK